MKLLDLIKEQSIGYTPEKIDQLVIESAEYVKKFRKHYEDIRTSLINLSMGECIETMNEHKTKSNKLSELLEIIETKETKYYNVLDTFHVTEYPDNVRLFYKNVSDLNLMLDDYRNLLRAYEQIIQVAEILGR